MGSEVKVTLSSRIAGLSEQIISDYAENRVIDQLEMFTQPDRRVIEELIAKLLRIVFPGFYRDYTYRIINPQVHLAALIEDVAFHLNRQISIALRGSRRMAEDAAVQRAEEITLAFLEKLPEIRSYLETDLQAGYDGDPAATSLDEVIMTYPAFIAIFTYRIAHRLYELGVPLIPRVMTEQAHETTGIDIHPGAKIGKYFFIDHGTGVVIGETTTIGEHVKLYQHVTLGAKSFPVGSDGMPVKGIKRHPDLGDRVVVYSGATILGGDTRIGDDCEVGGNVWLTHSLDPGVSIVTKASGQAMSTDNLGPEDSIEWFI